MPETFLYNINAEYIVFFLMFAMFGLFLFGRHLHKDQKANIQDMGPLTGFLFALLGLMLAFTFGMAGSRFDTRRGLVVQAANHMHEAILRSDLYREDSVRKAFKADLKDYVQARINWFDSKRNPAQVEEAKNETNRLFNKIWTRAAILARDPENMVASQQMIPVLNAMIEVAITREAATKAIVPEPVTYLLMIMILITSLMAGYATSIQKKFNYLAVIGFIVLVGCVVYIILDLDRPRRGLITNDKVNQFIVDLLQLF
jgi:amino acid transporter